MVSVPDLEVSWTAHNTFIIGSTLQCLSRERMSCFEQAHCWHGLFRNPVIVIGYGWPTWHHGEQGLEIPLEMMASLAGAPRLTSFGGALVLKGLSSMTSHVKCIGTSMPWHFTYNGDKARMSYNEGLQRHTDSNTCEKVADVLLRARHFLG